MQTTHKNNGYDPALLEYLEAFEDELLALEEETSTSSPLYTAWVQHTLNLLSNAGLAVDGDYGSNTRSAVTTFQRQQGLSADGVVGSLTQGKLVQAVNSRLQASPTSFCSGVQTPEALFGFDHNSDKVKPTHLPQLAKVAHCIISSQRGGKRVAGLRLVGHTDTSGSSSYNQTLGERRAASTRSALVEVLDRLSPGLASKLSIKVESRGERDARYSNTAQNRRVELFLTSSGGGATPSQPALAPLSAAEQAEYNRLSPAARAQFDQLRRTIQTYRDTARREADRGSRVLLSRGMFRSISDLLPQLIRLTQVSRLPSGWSLSAARPLLVGNVLYNLAFPETINQGGSDRLGGKPDPTCFSASTQMLLARRYPATYVRYTVELASTSKITFAGGATHGPLTFVSTSLYKSLESVLLQTAFDTYFNGVFSGGSYTPGDELKVHRQVFGASRPPKKVSWTPASVRAAAFFKAYVLSGGNTRPWELINLCTGNPSTPSSCGNHSVVLTRLANGRVYFYNPWANEEERNRMFGSGKVTVSGNGERPAESSMSMADFVAQLTAVFHN